VSALRGKLYVPVSFFDVVQRVPWETGGCERRDAGGFG